MIFYDPNTDTIYYNNRAYRGGDGPNQMDHADPYIERMVEDALEDTVTLDEIEEAAWATLAALRAYRQDHR